MVFSQLYSLKQPARNAIVEALAGNFAPWNEISNNPILVFEGENPNIVTRGIYTWGFKVLIEESSYFLPLYVGKTENDCIGRIIEHLTLDNKESVFGVKSLFKAPDTHAQITQLYNCIMNYNEFLIGAQEANPNRANHIQNRMLNFLAAANNDWLLYFQNRAFYQQTFPLCEDHNFHNIHNVVQATAITNLTIPFCEHTIQIANAMNHARAHLANNFCFSYAPVAHNYSFPLPTCEREVKERLAAMNLWTFSKPRILQPRINYDLNINFENIEALPNLL